MTQQTVEETDRIFRLCLGGVYQLNNEEETNVMTINCAIVMRVCLYLVIILILKLILFLCVWVYV
jgi:hypothetical protein